VSQNRAAVHLVSSEARCLLEIEAELYPFPVLGKPSRFGSLRRETLNFIGPVFGRTSRNSRFRSSSG
jgi:hypothetical protein